MPAGQPQSRPSHLVYILPPGQRDPYEAMGRRRPWSAGRPETCQQLFAGHGRLYPPGPSWSSRSITRRGTAQTDRSSVGIRFAQTASGQSVETNILANMLFNIPAAHQTTKDNEFKFPDDALVLSFMPHMHLRGTVPGTSWPTTDGKTETLLSVPDYDFGWQSVYRFAEPLKCPREQADVDRPLGQLGRQPRNPDPTKTVHWGLQTWDEMQNGWMEVVWKTPSHRASDRRGAKRLISRKGK